MAAGIDMKRTITMTTTNFDEEKKASGLSYASVVSTSEGLARTVPFGRTKQLLLSALRRSKEPLPTGILAERAGITSGQASTRLLELEEAGYIERSNKDRGTGSKSYWQMVSEDSE